MKRKRHLYIFLVFSVLLLLLTFAACEAINETEHISASWSDSTENETVSEVIEPNTETKAVSETETELVQKDLDLIEVLIDYLEYSNLNWDIGGRTFEEKLDAIKEGEHAVLLKFDTADRYYVCGYYDGKHERLRESIDHCCVSSYVWVTYENENEIKELHGDLRIAVSFQINSASYCQSIVPNRENPELAEHFQIYIPEFVDGINVASYIEFKDVFIQLWPPEYTGIYCSKDALLHDLYSIECVLVDGQYYINIGSVFSVSPNGEYREMDISRNLGKYYDDLVDVMINDKYTSTNTHGRIIGYGLCAFEDIINIVT